MKKILFSLMILAIYASANTCTETWFKAQTQFLSNSPNTPYLDSVYSAIYYLRQTEPTEKFVKLSYNNGYLEKIINGYVGDPDISIDYIYASKDESVLSKTGFEGLIFDSTVGDTTYWIRKHYENGNHYQTMLYKITKSYFSCKDSTNHIYNEYFFRNDSLIIIDIENYSSEANRKTEYTYMIEDSTDDLKCYEYRNDTLYHTLIYNNNEKGFSLKVFENNVITEELFFVNPDGTTAIHKRSAPIKISPKARYFDLLGRYKFTK